MAFNHENLNVYQRMLPFNVKVGIWTGEWDSKHAICDQLSRAAGSMLENVAMASAAYSSMKHRALDYAIGSSLECAGCLDLARIKRLLDAKGAYTEKEELSQILRVTQNLLPRDEVVGCKALLQRVSVMASSMIAGIQR